MSVTVFKEVGYSISKLVGEIESGEIGLPEIQRPFVWDNTKVRDLFDSMYRGFPVGYLLLWATDVPRSKRIGTDVKQHEAPRLLVVDGQQRLTSLYAVMTGTPVIDEQYRTRRIQVAFRPRDETFAVPDATTRRDPEYIDDITQLWRGELPHRRFVKAFVERLQASRDLSDEEIDHIEEAIDRLRDVHSYPFTAMELASSVDEERVAEIFVRINSKGVTLNQSDFILTLLSVFWEDGRKQLEAFSRQAKEPSAKGASPFNAYIQPSPDQLLRVAVGLAYRRGKLKSVYTLLRGRDIDSGQYSEETRKEQFARLQEAQAATLDLTNWHEFLKCVMRAGYRRSNEITSESAILYSYALWLVGRRDFGVDLGRLREAIARWFFMATITARYTGSFETIFESDIARFANLKTADEFVAEVDRIVATTLTNDFWSIQLPNALGTSSARSPALFGYFAALNLLDAKVLFSKLRVAELMDPHVKTKRASIERHHLFPRAYLATRGITDRKDVNQIANYAFVEWPDNLAISDTAPSEYFGEYMERHSKAEQAKMRFWHALPKEWESMPFDRFLEARRRLMADVVRAGFEKLSNPTADDVEDEAESVRSTRELMQLGEGAHIEFKSSARYNLHTRARDEKLEQVIVKTVAGFLNADGGTLLIGVNDDGEAVGLANDYELTKKGNRDGFELFLSDLFETHLGKPTLGQLSVTFEAVDSHDVCRVDVRPSIRPVFVKPPKGPKTADFYVRFGNSTRQLHADEVLDYEKEHWDDA
ncbi:MAG: DUF262 domain-containing protein [Sandaracinus sp.]|nr:DUF262 domain-containing protein [Sandaracinus sp.]